jgi:hypothetical protein
MENLENLKPSKQFCETGKLLDNEVYNQSIHNYGTTPQERCAEFYHEYKGGKSKKSRKPRRKSKKSRKTRRKSIRRR